MKFVAKAAVLQSLLQMIPKTRYDIVFFNSINKLVIQWSRNCIPMVHFVYRRIGSYLWKIYYKYLNAS